MAYKKPIQRSILVGCAVFIAFLCVMLSIQAYLLVSSALYARYDAQLLHVLSYVEHTIDKERLRAEIHSGIPDAQHRQIQSNFNLMVDDFELLYLYICIPLEDEAGTMLNVVASTSAAERARGEQDYPLLYASDAYTPEELAPYLKAWKASPEVTFYENRSDYGYCYTACQPLVTQSGETIALLCADLSVDALHHSVNSYVFSNVVLTVSISILFGLLLILWLRRDVTGPVVALEASARSFAARSHGQKNPNLLVFHAPDIHTQNEVESLSDAISQMSVDMKDYVQNILNAERRAENAEEEARGMSLLAYQDALTRMKSKTAYDEKKLRLARDINAGRAEFALVMVDLNHLKKTNDTYGHENGNSYIIGSCKIIGDVYRHSPVYRVGGDEFLVVLEGQDYRDRSELFGELRTRFQMAQEDELRKPWERYSAAAGMADYRAGDSVEEVFRRADEEMYENKKRTKAQRTV